MIQEAVGRPLKVQRGTAPILWLVGLLIRMCARPSRCSTSSIAPS